jgi:hypothetical protein
VVGVFAENVKSCSESGGCFGFRSSGDDFGLFYVFQVFSLYSGGGGSYDGGGSGNAMGFSADINSVVVVGGDEEVTR